MMSSIRKKYFGDKAFYKAVIALVIPMIIQAGVTSFVSLLDNIMVGQIGTAQMSGVSIVNQYVFIFNITVFGAVSGPSIFGAQFFGRGDYEGQKFTFRFRILAAALIALLGVMIFLVLGEPMITFFLSEQNEPELAAETLSYAKEYLKIIIFSLPPFAIGQAYSSVVRESGYTKIPMIASMSAVLINLFLDYSLIFGAFGMPRLGVAGAAIATVIAKVIEALVIMAWTHSYPEKNKYIVRAFRSLYIPGYLVGDMIKKGLPLLMNEFLWALGMSMIAQCYSVRGLEVVAARNISGTLGNLLNVVFVQMGSAIGIILGQLLGAGKKDQAKTDCTKLFTFSMIVSCLVGLLMFPASKFFPGIYNTEPAVKALASYMIIIQGIAMIVWAYNNACYFILRSGGKTGITFLFDSVFHCAVMVPIAYFLAYHTSMDIHMLYIVVTFSETIKSVIGYFLIRSGIWMNTII